MAKERRKMPAESERFRRLVEIALAMKRGEAEMESSEHSDLIIGRDIPWEAIKGEACRVKHFTPFATVEAGKVRHATSFLPYASLRVESPKLPQEASMPVVHKDDFRALWDVFQQRGVSPEEEVIVFYSPFYQKGLLRFLSAVLPRLHIFIYPTGHLEEVYDPNLRPDGSEAWFRPIAEWRPKYWRP